MKSSFKIIPCKFCGKDVKKAICRIRKETYCDVKCRVEGQKRRLNLNCGYCNKIVTGKRIKSRKTVYCDKVCKNLFKTVKVNCANCNKELVINKSKFIKRDRFFCDKKCHSERKLTSEVIPCFLCNKPVNKHKSQIGEKNYCSKKCYLKNSGSLKRSFSEILLYDLIKRDFPQINILQNNREILESGLEIDIFIKDINLAIELNGPCHYFNIYGDKALDGVKNRDFIKHAEIQKLGFKFIILNTSSLTKKKQITEFIEEQYINNIKPIINRLFR